MKAEIKSKALQLCSRRECCRKEIFDKALSWGCDSVEAQELVDYLVEQKFLDESRYTRAYVNDKLRFNKWGRVKIAYMLNMQKVDRNIIDDVLSEIDDNEYNEILTKELSKKMKNCLRDNDVTIRGKLFRFATGKGFEAENVTKAISNLMVAEKKMKKK